MIAVEIWYWQSKIRGESLAFESRSLEDNCFLFIMCSLWLPWDAVSANDVIACDEAAVTLELKKRAKQTKSVYIARTAVTWKLFSFHVTAVCELFVRLLACLALVWPRPQFIDGSSLVVSTHIFANMIRMWLCMSWSLERLAVSWNAHTH